MSVIQNNLLLSDEGYNLQRSLRFRSSASAYLNRTFASAGNRKTWTLSMWVKRGDLSTPAIFQQYTDGNNQSQIGINSSNSFRFYDLTGGSFAADVVWSPVYRDPSAWYHFVFQVDTTQATNTNRIRFYVNGTQVTSTTSATWPTQNADLRFNNNIAHFFAQNGASNQFFDGYMTEINFIDGQALTPSSFGQNNAQTGVWQPKRYTGTYGTNGFYLPFSDNSSLSNLTADRSGNGNNWTANNISLTAGATYDSMTDVPTLTSATQANFAVMNPLALTSTTLSNGNLTATKTAIGNINVVGTMAVQSGKYYWECAVTVQGSVSNINIGIARATVSNQAWSLNNLVIWGDRNPNEGIRYGTYLGAISSNIVQGDLLGIALDMDAGTIALYRNGSLVNTITGIDTTTPHVPYWNSYGSSDAGNLNFGQRPFAYTPPTGFVALNTFNLPTPTIGATASTQADNYFDAKTYTGTGATQTITVDFSSDFAWLKRRDGIGENVLLDILRLTGSRPNRLFSNSTAAESTAADGQNSFSSSGIVLDGTGGGGEVNTSGRTYVAWQWKANGTGVTNTAGSITSTVSANTSSGFSIVTYTGTGANATVGHGLGVAPRMVIVKNRSAMSPENTNWRVYHASTGNTGGLFLNTTAAFGANSTFWNNTTPTSSVFSIGTDIGVNNSGTTYVAYCFAEVAGFSRFGSYTGNDSTDGPFIYCGFRPKFILIKASNGAYSWQIMDSTRSTYNPSGEVLFPNASDAEAIASPNIADFLSNGFKLKRGGGSNATNGSSFSYIYMAFAENPFKYSLAR